MEENKDLDPKKVINDSATPSSIDDNKEENSLLENVTSTANDAIEKINDDVVNPVIETIKEDVIKPLEEKVIEPIAHAVEENVIEPIVEVAKELEQEIKEVAATVNQQQPFQQGNTFNQIAYNAALMPQKNNLGLVGFIFSIIAIFLFWLPFIGWLFWILGLVFSAIGIFRKPKGLAIAGLIISLIGLLFFIVGAALLAAAFAMNM